MARTGVSHNGDLRAAGRLLKQLREERGFTNHSLHMASDLSPNTISRLENGKILNPEREIIERFLHPLDQKSTVSYADKTNLFRRLGYEVAGGMPDRADVEKAKAGCAGTLKTLPYPAYLVDYSQRIHAWNDLVPLFMGHGAGTPVPPGLTVFDLAFRRTAKGQLTIVNGEALLREMVRVMKSEFKAFEDEVWCQKCVADAERRYFEFDALYRSISDEELSPITVRVIEPVILSDSEGHIFQFKIIGIDLADDRRFRVVQYVSLTPETSAFCFHLGSL